MFNKDSLHAFECIFFPKAVLQDHLAVQPEYSYNFTYFEISCFQPVMLICIQKSFAAIYHAKKLPCDTARQMLLKKTL
jgi:hypothetical protein